MPYALPVLVLAAITALVFFGMYRGWQRRKRTIVVQELPALPAAAPPASGVDGVYVATTLYRQPWQRVVAQGLGTKSGVHVLIRADGVLLERGRARDIFIPTTQLRQVRLASGMVGKVVDTDGLIVITWQVGDQQLDTGLRTRYSADRPTLVERIDSLISSTQAGHKAHG